MKQERAPTMAEHELYSSVLDHHSVEYPFSCVLETIENSYSSNENNSQFVFTIEPSLLIDPRNVKIGRVIGDGPNSTVYEGLYFSRLVAVKIIEPIKTSEASADRKEKFQREVIMLSQMRHANVIRFIGAAVDPCMIIITELMRGGTLQKYLWNMRPNTLDWKCALTFAMDICSAMEYLHGKGIIHRDLKPSNILLTDDKEHVKLADFGLAREVTSGEMTTEAGTYRWMAPEIFSIEPLPIGAKKVYDHKVDVYSFSIILWELLTNKTPFKGRGSMMVAFATAKKLRPDVDEIPNEVVSLLESCWADDPKNRPEFFYIKNTLLALYQRLFPPEEDPEEEPMEDPMEEPTEDPIEEPTEEPMEEPTEVPTEDLTEVPTEDPTEVPIEVPTEDPTEVPIEVPTEDPTEVFQEAPKAYEVPTPNSNSSKGVNDSPGNQTLPLVKPGNNNKLLKRRRPWSFFSCCRCF